MSSIEDYKNYFNEILHKVQPKNLIKNTCNITEEFIEFNSQKIYFPKNKKIKLYGSGKAVLNMAEAIFETIPNKIERSVLVGPYDNHLDYENLTYIKAGHPLPNDKSIEAGEILINEFESHNSDDFYIYLLSGGTSALIEKSTENISLEDFQETTDLMLKNAMPIEAINCVRKHISQIKGGRLASFSKAKGVVIVLSDVLGDDLEAIGSAPLYFDKTSFYDAKQFLQEYQIIEKVPFSVKNYLSKGINGLVDESPKVQPENLEFLMVGTNKVLLNTAKEVLNSKDINPIILDKQISKNVDEEVKDILNIITNKQGCFILGGEATVNVKGNGKGGRNQHLVLKLLSQFPKNKNLLFLSGASDGIDGNSDAAGAVIDNSILELIENEKIDINKYLDNFDSNTLFEKINCLLKSGPSHNNILDLIIINTETKE